MPRGITRLCVASGRMGGRDDGRVIPRGNPRCFFFLRGGGVVISNMYMDVSENSGTP